MSTDIFQKKNSVLLCIIPWGRKFKILLLINFFSLYEQKRWLIVPLCAVLCSQGLFAQTLDRRVLGIDEMFRLADENSQSIQTYKTGKEAADEALKAAKSQRLPDIGASLSFSYLGDGYIWDRDFKNGRISLCHTSAITLRWKRNK